MLGHDNQGWAADLVVKNESDILDWISGVIPNLLSSIFTITQSPSRYERMPISPDHQALGSGQKI